MRLFNRKKQPSFQHSAKSMGAVDTLIKNNLLKVNINTYEVHVSRTLIWDGKDQKWKKNFLTNIHLYIGIKRAMHQQDHRSSPIRVLDMDTKELLDERLITDK